MDAAPAETSPRPWMLGRRPVLDALAPRCPLPSPLPFDILDPASLGFYRLLNAGNQLAFGGVGMPAWVQLDCAALPSALVGLCVPRADAPDELWGRLLGMVRRDFGDEAADALEGYQGPVPLSSYCAAASVEPGLVVGFSLFSLVPGLGIRTKATAMLCYGAHRQLGVTQYQPRTLRAHSAFGPLRLVTPRALAHTRPEESFVYELSLEDEGLLRRLALGGEAAAVAPQAPDFTVALGAQVAARVEALAQAHGPLQVLPPGLVQGPDGPSVALGPVAP